MKIKLNEVHDEQFNIDTSMPVLTICARIINKLFVDGYTFQEIAEIADCTVEDITAIYGEDPNTIED